MIPDERRYSSEWFYQCIQSRYGFNPHHLRLVDGCEFFISPPNDNSCIIIWS